MKYEKEIVIKAMKGDREAFSDLYYSCYREFYNFAFYTLGNSEDASDAVADAFVEIWKGIGKLRVPEAFGSWAFKILGIRCKKEISDRIKRRCELCLEDFEEMPLPDSENAEERLLKNADLAFALCELESEERLLILLSAFYGYTHREIAKILGIPRGTVSSKLHRIYAKLRMRLCEK
ncbi:MAG: sigma-70 family RNA polymerase sigma factor [Oscillospiraceae bacterium]|nr:sigma-70 family RNA polymerase sigma factor [Oscillospiraceae bacterium]